MESETPSAAAVTTVPAPMSTPASAPAPTPTPKPSLTPVVEERDGTSLSAPLLLPPADSPCDVNAGDSEGIVVVSGPEEGIGVGVGAPFEGSPLAVLAGAAIANAAAVMGAEDGGGSSEGGRRDSASAGTNIVPDSALSAAVGPASQCPMPGSAVIGDGGDNSTSVATAGAIAGKTDAAGRNRNDSAVGVCNDLQPRAVTTVAAVVAVPHVSEILSLPARGSLKKPLLESESASEHTAEEPAAAPIAGPGAGAGAGECDDAAVVAERAAIDPTFSSPSETTRPMDIDVSPGAGVEASTTVDSGASRIVPAAAPGAESMVESTGISDAPGNGIDPVAMDEDTMVKDTDGAEFSAIPTAATGGAAAIAQSSDNAIAAGTVVANKTERGDCVMAGADADAAEVAGSTNSGSETASSSTAAAAPLGLAPALWVPSDTTADAADQSKKCTPAAKDEKYARKVWPADAAATSGEPSRSPPMNLAAGRGGPDVIPPPMEAVIEIRREDGERGSGGGTTDRLYGAHCLEREAAARAFFEEQDLLRRRFQAAVDLVELDKAVEIAGLELRSGCRMAQTLKMRLKTRWREGGVLQHNGNSNEISRCTSKEAHQAAQRRQEQVRHVIADHKELLREVLGRQRLEAGALQMSQEMEVPKGSAPLLQVRSAFPRMFDEVSFTVPVDMYWCIAFSFACFETCFAH